MRMARTSDSVMSYVNRQDRRRSYEGTSTKGATFMQLLLMTAGICIATMSVFHFCIF